MGYLTGCGGFFMLMLLHRRVLNAASALSINPVSSPCQPVSAIGGKNDGE